MHTANLRSVRTNEQPTFSVFWVQPVMILAIVVLLGSTGCRNRCANTCGGGGGLFAANGSPTIGAPQTYSMNIPSVAQNQPYYVPGNNAAGSGTRSALNTNAAAPTPATQRFDNRRSANGWQPVDGRTGSVSPGSPNNPTNTGSSVLSNSPTTFVDNSRPPQNRTASTANSVLSNSVLSNSPLSNQVLPGSGQSFTDSRDYRTTNINETSDQTRLPVTDASTVRAPARSFVGSNRIAQLPRPTTPQFPPSYNVPASVGQPVYAGQVQVASNPYQPRPTFQVNPGFVAQPNYTSQPAIQNFGTNGVYRGVPTFNGVPVNSQPAVLAQSTATFDAGSGTKSAGFGWRDREIGSSTN